MNEYCTIYDGTTTVFFFGNPDVKPFIKLVGASYDPLGYGKTVVTRDVARRGATWTMVAIDSGTLLPTIAADAALAAMLGRPVPLTITDPDGTTMVVTPDPGIDPVGIITYSQWLFQYVNTWTVKFFEVDEAF